MSSKSRIRETTTKFFVDALKEGGEEKDINVISNLASQIEDEVYS